jgi:hypothetical protein
MMDPFLPGTPIRITDTRRSGVIIATPKGQNVDWCRVWADLGSGPEQVDCDKVMVLADSRAERSRRPSW